ncbi:type I restriction endonuclease [Chitinibacter sp. GC72]|uniref:type I restriction endonuclease n=1 Tax=Chitinibacter sp. GC72 TaxID=1526917 RepID=UPI0012F8F4BC|nr:type I restriction endonuclease [Chitinibacter sp. GC72]
MENFTQRIKTHIQHVNNVGSHCNSEETTKQALILPLLDILGFSPYDPTKVKAEYAADFPGAKNNERVDYALFCQGVPVMFIEAKAFTEKLSNHAPQLARYFNATPEVAVAALTNGQEWRFFTDLNNKNVMDEKPFLTVDFSSGEIEETQQLARFRHDQFQPDALRTLAEESIYLTAFKAAISSSLREVDAEFVRYIATKANIQRQFNQRFIDSITPLVRQAVERAVSEMVLTGLSSPSAEISQAPIAAEPPTNAKSEDGDWVHPDNSRIITTAAERRLHNIAQEILGDEHDVQAKDTESYFTLLYQGKTNRWLLRYYGDKKQPTISLPFDISESQKNEINRAGLNLASNGHINLDKPEHLHRISGLLRDALEHACNDENFKRQTA